MHAPPGVSGLSALPNAAAVKPGGTIIPLRQKLRKAGAPACSGARVLNLIWVVYQMRDRFV
jgi:hypothetical protein